MHIRQAKIAAGVVVGEAFVIEAETVQDRRLKVVDVNGILDDVESEVVGGAEGHARLDAAACDPHRERLRMMIAACGAAERWIGFDHRRASEFAAPDDERVVEQSLAFQIGHECGRCLVGVLRVVLDIAFDVAVRVPAAVNNADETHAALDHAASQQAGSGEAWLFRFAAVQLERLLCFG